MFPKHANYLMESFEDATSKPYGYLMIDCHQLTPENMRLRTNILPGERQIVYVKRTVKLRMFWKFIICKMSKRMRGSLPYLQVIVKSKPKLRKLLIENVPANVITAICECSLDLLKGVIPLTPRQKRRLARYKTHLRALANKKVSRKQKKKHLNKKGGNLLTAVLPPVLSVLWSLLVK
jgi:hypothetical protein